MIMKTYKPITYYQISVVESGYREIIHELATDRKDWVISRAKKLKKNLSLSKGSRVEVHKIVETRIPIR